MQDIPGSPFYFLPVLKLMVNHENCTILSPKVSSCVNNLIICGNNPPAESTYLFTSFMNITFPYFWEITHLGHFS